MRRSSGAGRWALGGGSAALVVCAGAFLLAAQAPQPPTFRAGVNVVRVDVIVTDKTGALVSNLTQDDFEITEQGKPQKVDTFKLVSLDGGLWRARPRAIASTRMRRARRRDDVRLFGIFLDDYHVSRRRASRARDQIARFIATDLGPSDMVGLMYPLTPLSSDAADAQPRRHPERHRAVPRPQGRVRAARSRPVEETAWEGARSSPGASNGSAIRCRTRRSRASSCISAVSRKAVRRSFS